MSIVGAYLRCPFNESHRIIEGRLQKHLFKCRRNYPKNYKVCCPFDATHMLDPYEYEHHLSVCTTSGNVKCYENSFEPEQEVGTIPIEKACNLQTNTLDNEDWSGNNPTYNPLVATANKQIVRTAIGLSKAKKKEFRQLERQRISALENDKNKSDSKQSIGHKEPRFEKPLRPPKKAAKALSCTEGSGSMANTVSISDLISKLKEVTVDEVNDSLLEKNISQCEEKENILQEEINTSVNKQNTFNAKVNISGAKNISTMNRHSSQDDHCKRLEQSNEVTDQKHNVHDNSTEGTGTASRKVCHLSPRMAANLCGEVKKISTGRGFTIAYQHLKAEVSRNKTIDIDEKDFSIIYGYNEDEKNSDPQNKLESL